MNRTRKSKLLSFLAPFLFFVLPISIVGTAEAKQPTVQSVILDEDAVSETTYATVTLDNVDGLSIQAVNSAGVSLSSGTFDDGQKSTGSITVADYTKLHLTAASGSVTVDDYTALRLTKATNTLTVDDYTVLFATPAVPSVSTITYGSPTDGTISFNNMPTSGTTTFTYTASLPGANEFNDIGDLTLLIDGLSEFSASNDGTDITIVVVSSGTGVADGTVTGTGDYSGLSITFSGGRENATVTVAGHVLTQGTDWTASVSSGTTGASLSDAINALVVVASTHNAYGVIYATAATAGTAGNSITLASSDGTNLALGGATFSGGIDAATLTVAGHVLTESTDFDAVTSSITTAGNIHTAVNALSEVNSTDNGDGSVTITAATAGSAGNSIALASSDAVNLALSGAVLTGGVDAATFTIGGNVLTESTDWDATSSNNQTATNLAAAIDALSILSSNASSAVVYTTATFPGTIGNYAMVSSTGTYLTPSAANMSGGVNPDVSTTTANITISTHGWSDGTALLFETVSGTAPTGLTTGTTYYAIYVDANNIQLASSLANAEAGTEISITAFTGLGSFGLTPLTWTGNAVKLQASNDNTNWSDISGTSTTLTAAGNTIWNIIDPFYKYIRFVYTPSAGATDLTVTVYGKGD